MTATQTLTTAAGEAQEVHCSLLHNISPSHLEKKKILLLQFRGFWFLWVHSMSPARNPTCATAARTISLVPWIAPNKNTAQTGAHAFLQCCATSLNNQNDFLIAQSDSMAQRERGSLSPAQHFQCRQVACSPPAVGQQKVGLGLPCPEALLAGEQMAFPFLKHPQAGWIFQAQRKEGKTFPRSLKASYTWKDLTSHSANK